MAIWYKRQCLTVGFFLVSLHISAISILISSCVCVFSYSYSVCYFFCFDALRMACNASGNVLYVTLSSAPKSTPIPCTHTSVFHRSFLLCSSLFSMRTFQSLARSFTWFLFCVLLYIYIFFPSFTLVLFFIGANATSTFAGTFDIVAVVRIFQLDSTLSLSLIL